MLRSYEVSTGKNDLYLFPSSVCHADFWKFFLPRLLEVRTSFTKSVEPFLVKLRTIQASQYTCVAMTYEENLTLAFWENWVNVKITCYLKVFSENIEFLNLQELKSFYTQLMKHSSQGKCLPKILEKFFRWILCHTGWHLYGLGKRIFRNTYEM